MDSSNMDYSSMDSSNSVGQQGLRFATALPDFRSLKLPEPEVSPSPEPAFLAFTPSPGTEMDDCPGLPSSRPRRTLLHAKRRCRAARRTRQSSTPKAEKERMSRNWLNEPIILMQNLIQERFGPWAHAHWKPLNPNNSNRGLKFNKLDILRTSYQLLMHIFP